MLSERHEIYTIPPVLIFSFGIFRLPSTSVIGETLNRVRMREMDRNSSSSATAFPGQTLAIVFAELSRVKRKILKPHTVSQIRKQRPGRGCYDREVLRATCLD